MSRVLLPQVHGNAAVTAAQGDVQMTPRAYQFASAWLGLLGARADIMHSDPRLIRCAQEHAEWLAPRLDNKASNHIGEGGTTPNQRVRASGFKLLGWHKDGNTVESLKRTWENVDEDMLGIVSRLMAHETHHDHMWGLNWYSGHTMWGIGAATEPSGSWVFVVDCCPPPEETA